MRTGNTDHIIYKMICIGVLIIISVPLEHFYEFSSLSTHISAALGPVCIRN